MATTLYLKQQYNSCVNAVNFLTQENGTDLFTLEDNSGSLTLENNYQYASLIRSVLTLATAITNTVASGSNIEVTQTPNGVLVSWISPPVAAQVVISGNITSNLWAFESAAAANATVAVTIAKYLLNAGEQSPFFSASFGTELGTSAAVCNWTASPTATGLSVGDRLAINVLITNATAQTMGGGATVTLDYAGLTAAADGDCFITFTEAISFQNEAEMIQYAPAGATAVFPGKTAQGNAIVMWVEWLIPGSGGTITGLTGGSDGTNSYSVKQNDTTDGAGMLVGQNLTAGGPYTVAPTFSGTPDGSQAGWAVEFAGVDPSAFDVFGAIQTATSSAPSSGSATTHFPNVVIIGLVDPDAGGQSINPAPGFISRAPSHPVIDMSVNTTGTYNASGIVVTSAQWFMGMIVLKWGTQPPPIDEDFWNDSGLPSRAAAHYREDPVVMVW